MTETPRVKLCGLMRADDVRAAVAAGADYLGFVLAPDSPRALAPAALGALLHDVDTGFAQRVVVVRDQPAAWINDVVLACGVDFVQLHGREPRDFPAALVVPVLRARPVAPAATPAPASGIDAAARKAAGGAAAVADVDTTAAAGAPESAAARLVPGGWPPAPVPLAPNVFAVVLDTAGTDGTLHGGSGRRADAPAVRAALAALPPGTRVFLAGGLTPDNVAASVRKFRPWGVDVASGIETAPGVKDAARMRAFVQAAKQAL
jgi:phosphoribosylanthranilate isomerase